MPANRGQEEWGEGNSQLGMGPAKKGKGKRKVLGVLTQLPTSGRVSQRRG